jgi:hypothetical protein
MVARIPLTHFESGFDDRKECSITACVLHDLAPKVAINLARWGLSAGQERERLADSFEQWPKWRR